MTDNVSPIKRRQGLKPEEQATTQTYDASYEMDDGRYSLDEFYVASTNQHDHSESFALKLPKHVKALAQEFIGNPEFPAYRSANDVMRDSLVHRLKYLSEHYEVDPQVRSWIKTETMRTRVDRIDAELAAQEVLVERTREVIQRAVENRNKRALEELTIGATEFLEDAEEPYRSNIIEHLRVGLQTLGMDDSILLGIIGEETSERFDPTVEIEAFKNLTRNTPDDNAT